MNLTVNTEACIKCGICVAECPTGLLVMTAEGPNKGKGGCIACGHCVAACPTKAIDNDLTPRAQQVEIDSAKKFGPDQAEMFLRSRRSIRNYQDKAVSTADIMRILNVARMAPTATNSQGISYIVVRNKDTLAQISEAVLAWMHEAAKTSAMMRLYVRGAQAEVDKGRDYILRSAPALVVAYGPKKDIDRTRASGHSCLTYAELFAPTLGLGSCWAGFFEYACFAGDTRVLNLVGVPEDKEMAGAILLGYPKFKYRNIVERNDLDLTFKD